MLVTWISQFRWAAVTLGAVQSYTTAIVGIMLVPSMQLLVTPVQIALNSRGVNFPGSIIVMALCTITMLGIEYLHQGIGSVYDSYLKGPVDFLGRHMSLGFVTPLVMLSKDHITTIKDVPCIIEAFVVTTLVSYVASAVIAGGLYKIEERLRGLRRQHDDAEKMTMPVWPSSRHSERTPPPENRTALQHAGSPSESDAIGLPSTTAGFIARTVPVWISILLLVTIGIPVYRVTNYDMPFEAFYFTLSWAMALQLQRSVKKCKSLETWPRVRSTLAVILNPVLVTAGLGTAYFWAEAAVTHSSIDDVLSSFHRHDTWAEAMAGSIADRSAQRHVGAGDLSSALLDAGIVSLGPKMFEHRRALRASLATVVVASLALAVADALLGVAVARRLLAGAFPAHDDDDPGLPPAAAADALAFAARSVTVALGAPAVRCLGGSTMLMSALAVVGGMLWQAAGNTVLRWLGVRDRRGQQGSHSIWHGSGDAVRGNAGGAGGGGSRNRGNRQHGGNGGEPDDPEEEVDGGVDYKVIAAGVTVGVNAGVMGTAHLIERDSMATAHSALSMTIFGVFTVVLTSVPPFADVLTRLASR